MGAVAAAFLVHLLTASGAVCGLLALRAATRHEWAAAFIWLGVALVIDALDGPFARRIRAEQILPRFSGARLDLVVDYLNYCAIPAFIVMESGLTGAGTGLAAAALIMLTSLFHFADRQSKTGDGYFVGFPAIWNIVCLYLFVLGLSPRASLAVIVILAALTFVPLAWVHPFRVKALRHVTVGVVAVWTAAALAAVTGGFPSGPLVQGIFAAAALYMGAIGLRRTWRRHDGA